jgi:hypothetical protein
VPEPFTLYSRGKAHALLVNKHLAQAACKKQHMKKLNVSTKKRAQQRA